MKHQDQASSRDLEKRLRFSGQYRRIGDEAAGGSEGNDGEKDGGDPRELSPSMRFFLTK